LKNNKLNESDLTYYRIGLEEVGEGKLFTFELQETFKRRLTPFPFEIKIKDD